MSSNRSSLLAQFLDESFSTSNTAASSSWCAADNFPAYDLPEFTDTGAIAGARALQRHRFTFFADQQSTDSAAAEKAAEKAKETEDIGKDETEEISRMTLTGSQKFFKN